MRYPDIFMSDILFYYISYSSCDFMQVGGRDTVVLAQAISRWEKTRTEHVLHLVYGPF